MSTKKGRKEGEESKEGKGRERKGGRKEGEGGKERRSSRKEGTERKNVCVHARAPSWTPPQIHPGVNIYVAKRNQEREGKSREGQGMEGKSREGQGREEQGSYLQPSPTSVHTLPIPIWTPPCPGVDPSPRHTPPIPNNWTSHPNETTSLGTWWSSTSVLKKKNLGWNKTSTT